MTIMESVKGVLELQAKCYKNSDWLVGMVSTQDEEYLSGKW